MYAIVEVGGMQWKVSKKKTLRVPKMNIEPGKVINIEKVLLVVDGENVTIGKPLVTGVQVKAKVVSHGKDKKVIVFKKKRRKDYKVTKGHRQDYTELLIDQISTGKGETEKAAPPAQKKPDTISKKESMETGSGSPKTTEIKKASSKSRTPLKKKDSETKKSTSAKTSAVKKTTAKKTETAQKTVKKPAAKSTTRAAGQTKKKE